MNETFSEAELEAYLEELLDGDRSADIERSVRSDPKLLERLSNVNARRDAGMHTLGAIWRREQIGVPTREELGSYLLGVLPEERADYIRFRVETLRCRYTIAKLMDLERQQSEADEQIATRRTKIFQTSAGYLRGKKRE